MRNRLKFLAVSAMLSLPVSLLAADSNWYNPKSWFNKSNKNVSTTVTGNVESIKDQVIFKTLDGQTLLLIGNKATKVGECGKEARIRVFGNIYKPSDKYPTGALQVRNYKILEGAPANNEVSNSSTTATTPTTPTASNATYEEATPEPYAEPVIEETTHQVTENIPDNIITAVDQEETIEPYEEEEEEETAPATPTKTYVVQSGDTLGKISNKLFGTTAKWKKIAEANKITNPKHLKVGMTLIVPEL